MIEMSAAGNSSTCKMPGGFEQQRKEQLETAKILQDLRASSPLNKNTDGSHSAGYMQRKKREITSDCESFTKNKAKQLLPMISFDWSNREQSKSSSHPANEYQRQMKRPKTSTLLERAFSMDQSINETPIMQELQQGPSPRHDFMPSSHACSASQPDAISFSAIIEEVLRARVLQRQLNLLRLSNSIALSAYADPDMNDLSCLDLLSREQPVQPNNILTKESLCQPVGQMQEPISIQSASGATPSANLKTCRMDGCNDHAAKRTPYCSNHTGPRKCEWNECTKFAQGRTRFCIAHGGGRRCEFPSCTKSARDKRFCASHGGGKRCSTQGCAKLAVGRSSKCTACGGGKRCKAENCTKGAQSSFDYCVQHGGGHRCRLQGCNKVARGKIMLCMSHAMSSCSRAGGLRRNDGVYNEIMGRDESKRGKEVAEIHPSVARS